MSTVRSLVGSDTLLLGVGVALTLLAVVNLLDGVHGGALFAGLGGVLAFAFALLTE